MFSNQTNQTPSKSDLFVTFSLRSISFAILILAATLISSASVAVAQPTRARMDGAEPTVEEVYEMALVECRLAVKHYRRETMLYFDRGLDEADERAETWKMTVKKLLVKSDELKIAGTNYFLDAEEPSPELIDLMLQAGPDLILGDNPNEAMKVVRKLRKLKPDILPLQRDEALLAYRLNQFDEAIAFNKLNVPELLEEVPPMKRGLFGSAAKVKEAYERELEIRAVEAKADDLPRVKIKTVHGDIVIELFENEAPETVASFIYLVELGFYDGTYFHRVIHELLAHGGGFTKLGRQECGYFIKDEMRTENARRHFRGSVCMANKATPNSASSEFYITTSPTPALDWDGTDKDVAANTVFGRVISGMNAVDKLTTTFQIDHDENKEVFIEGIQPDEIVKASVIRKRDHEYKPTRISSEK